MNGIVLVSVLLVAITGWAQEIEQTSEGWCSPNVAKSQGQVTIICQGVSPEALKRLNELLDLKDKELGTAKRSLADKIKEAEDWAERYRELEARLAAQGSEDTLAQQAKEALGKGNLERAGALLDEILQREEKTVDQAAANNFSRAQVYQLQFQPLKALPYLEKAYRYRPENVAYAFAYATLLQEQHDFKPAETIYTAVLTRLRERAKSDSAAYLPDVATTLNNLGNLYSATQRLAAAQQAYQEALQIRRELAKQNPAAYLPYVAMTLNNLGVLYSDTQRLAAAQQAYQEALQTYRELAKQNPAAYLPYLAKVLNNLADFYKASKHPEDANKLYRELDAVRRQLESLRKPEKP
jgi:tetratricopeptide (TPR) repeat protein